LSGGEATLFWRRDSLQTKRRAFGGDVKRRYQHGTVTVEDAVVAIASGIG
jgi:hypothetical protein